MRKKEEAEKDAEKRPGIAGALFSDGFSRMKTPYSEASIP
jgi:hypothetical protein